MSNDVIWRAAYAICKAHPPHAHRPRCDCLDGYDHQQPPCADKIAQAKAAARVLLEDLSSKAAIDRRTVDGIDYIRERVIQDYARERLGIDLTSPAEKAPTDAP